MSELDLPDYLLDASKGVAHERNQHLSLLAADAATKLAMHLLGEELKGDSVKGIANVIRNTLNERMEMSSGKLFILYPFMLLDATLKYSNLKREQIPTFEKLTLHLEDIYQKLYSYQSQPREEVTRLKDFCIHLNELHLAARADSSPYRRGLVHA